MPLVALVILQSQQSNRMYMLLLPPLAVLATFALPTLKRGAINAIDWFAVLSFTILGTFVWLVWLASITGFPHPLARNLARLVPGYEPHFKILSFICAVIATVCWCFLVRWRISRQPKVLWRSVVLSGAGTTLMWVLLMTLWLPIVNYGRTYRDVAQQIAVHLPSDYECISPVRLGDAQIATFAYFGNMRFDFSGDCDDPAPTARTSASRADVAIRGVSCGKAAAPPTVTSASACTSASNGRRRLSAASAAPPAGRLTMFGDIRRIVGLAWPVLVGQLAIIAFGVIDTAMVGRYSAVDLAALAGSSIYISIYIGLTGILSALQPITGQRGARRYAEIGEVRRALWLALLLAVPGFLLLHFPEPLLRVAHACRAARPHRRLSAHPVVRAARQPRLPHLQRADQRGRQAAPRDDPADRRAAAQVPAQRVVHLRRVRRAGPRRPRLRPRAR